MSSLFDLSGKRAIVTGVTHGLGMAMAKGLAEVAAELIINSSTPFRVEKTVKKYESQGHKVHSFIFDVTKECRVRDHDNRVEQEINPVNVLVNNAAISKRILLKDMDIDEYQKKIIDVDLAESFLMAKYVVCHMISRNEGKIINICSMMTELGRDTVGAYAAVKGGLKMLTISMATEWAHYNIQANGIGPGYFAASQTELIRNNGRPFNDFIKNRTPAGRWGNPFGLAETAVFLSSQAGDFAKGQIVYVDVGKLATICKPANEK